MADVQAAAMIARAVTRMVVVNWNVYKVSKGVELFIRNNRRVGERIKERESYWEDEVMCGDKRCQSSDSEPSAWCCLRPPREKAPHHTPKTCCADATVYLARSWFLAPTTLLVGSVFSTEQSTTAGSVISGPPILREPGQMIYERWK